MENYQIIIVYLDKNGFDLYTPTQKSCIRFTFSKEIFQDMEVMNVDTFMVAITTFITKYTIPPSPVVILISEILLFIKDIRTIVPSSKDAQIPSQEISAIGQQQQIQQFLDTIPFEFIESKTFLIEGGLRIVATNKTLLDIIKIAFEEEKSVVKAIVPAFLIVTENEGEGLTDEVIAMTISNIEALKQESFAIHPEEIIISTPEEKKKEFLSLPKKQNKLYAYISIFIALLGILGVMFKTMTNTALREETQKQIIPSNNQIAGIIPTSMPTQIPTVAIPINSYIASTSASINRATIHIQIEISETTAIQGQLIKNKLLEKGYTNVIIANTAPTITEKTLVMFSSTIDSSIQPEIISVINNIFTNFSPQQSTQTRFDIIIIPSNNL